MGVCVWGGVCVCVLSLHLSLTIIFRVMHHAHRYGYGCRRDLSKSGNLKGKKIGISFTKSNILYFLITIFISTSFVH